ncbi:MAG TPA: helix-turn-helix domain-containing protein [Candidatus Avipropionibacterium avicola]|uniref:Helix-turn-helix domain-containing protein n=1 Tax=Candidatus Avipropionibacterium avicola TaxID=2840701 RepID=A0A9D1KNW3_9ACTN|nr:helix-turn-helix domain-containing protein [Candidatus Avipropionibacterium avicola]
MANPATPKRTTRLTDPRTIRALAHEVRQALVIELGRGREFTATEVAKELGISPSAMSYHLRLLEKYGLAERADPSADARERHWRGTFDALILSPEDAEGTLDESAALAHLEIFQAAIRQSVTTAIGLADQDGDNAGITIARSQLRLSPAEMEELTERTRQLWEEFEQRPATDDEPRMAVDLFSLTVPQENPAPGTPSN